MIINNVLFDKQNLKIVRKYNRSEVETLHTCTAWWEADAYCLHYNLSLLQSCAEDPSDEGTPLYVIYGFTLLKFSRLYQ